MKSEIFLLCIFAALGVLVTFKLTGNGFIGIGTVTLIGAGIVFICKWLGRRRKNELDAATELKRRYSEDLSNLSESEIQSRALASLEDRTKWRCEVVPFADESALPSLAPGLRKIFMKYKTIDRLGGFLLLDRSEPWEWDQDERYLVIGHAGEGTVLLVNANDETVREHTLGEGHEDDAVYSTVYHLILSH
jgi:hypothetical protein